MNTDGARARAPRSLAHYYAAALCALVVAATTAPASAAPFATIERALAAGEIDAGQATAYRYFSVFEPDRLTYFMCGAVMYLVFLHERYFPGDPAFIARAWHGMRSPARGAFFPRALNEPDFADALDAQLRAHAGVSYEESVLELARWRWFAASRDDGQHFSEGAQWRRAAVPAREAALPFAGTMSAPQVGGVAYFDADTAGATPGARLRVAVRGGDAERAWHVEALRYDAQGAHDDWSVVLDATGGGAAAIAVRGAARVALLVQHTPPPGYDPDYYETETQLIHVELELVE